MTPAARVATAIDVLDAIAAGASAEQALRRWARTSRFAGSKDRAAVRDHVFDVLRHWRSDAVRGGGETGRARMIGRLRAQGADLDAVLDGSKYGAAQLSAQERAAGREPQAQGDCWDLPDWLIPHFEDSLGGDAARTAVMLTERAPVTLRVNIARTTRPQARAALAEDGIIAQDNDRAPTALTALEGARRIRNAETYRSGLVELQDASSQAAVAGLRGQGRALDYCAGGGGKALALAAAGWDVTAHDVAAERMKDLPERAERGEHRIALCDRKALEKQGKFDLVFCDAPCSGSGTWRRTPEAKWTLTNDRLNALCDIQRDVLEVAAPFVAEAGKLVYATCSVLKAENADCIAAFLQSHPEWRQQSARYWPVDESGDGFFCAHLTKHG